MRRARQLSGGAASVVTAALAVFAALLITVRVLGYSAAVVTGGSMEPAIGLGSVILIEPTAPSAVRVGDVITFRLPDRLITHRVVAIQSDDAGIRLVTKGDANDAADPIAVHAGGAIGTVRLAIPFAGYALFELQTWWRAIALTILIVIAAGAAGRWLGRERSARAAPSVA